MNIIEISKKHEYWMREALNLAKVSFDKNEVPVGAVVVKDNIMVGTGCNSVEESNMSSGHAEMLAINNAGKFLNSWRLINCEIYVTLEPCMMCIGAINLCRISTLIYGAKNHQFGAVQHISKKVNVVSGILENECSDILLRFFRNLRR